MIEVFLEDARALIDAARDAVLGGAPADAAGPLQAIALDAAVLDMPELAELATSLVGISERASRDDAVLSAGLQSLTEVLDELRSADESGARYDASRLRKAADALKTVPPPPPVPATPRLDDEATWTPTVDEDMIDPFLEECNDRLESLSERLLELEQSPEDPELVRAIFRDLHTLKGSSGFVGLKKMARLAHKAEDLVGQVRDGTRGADRGVVDALLATLDVLQAIVQRAADRAPIDVEIAGVVQQLQTPRAVATSSTPAAVAAAPVVRDSPRAAQTLRVEFAKLDELMNLVGELVLSKGHVRSGLEDLAGLAREIELQRRGARRNSDSSSRRTGQVRLQDFATELGRVQRAFDALHQDMEQAHRQLEFVSGQLRDQVMKLRMIPVGRGWSKYHRTVRQIASGLGKEVQLVLSGEETELDKVLVEQLDDPLMHLVRNAIDHGIETPAQRQDSGKPEAGTVSLSAYHRGNQIVISIEDDGRGIDATKVRAKAVERGLVSAEAAEELELEKVYDLIFHAGFSTAEQVSDLSGRGVGMDVVRESIHRLKGTVHVDSTLGLGTRFELRLPLTLAIVQVLLLRAGGQTFAVPLDLVRRTLSVLPAEVRQVGRQDTLLLHGEELPLLHLRPLLGLPTAAGATSHAHSVVLVEIGSQQIGLVCDEFLGRREVVLKSMGTLLKRVPGVAGATLLGDRPAIILDVPALAAMAMRDPDRARAHPTEAPPPIEVESARILVVEDSDVIRETIRRTLERAGFEVVVARDGAEGLARAREGTFDLVSTDVVMPNMDGYELTRRLRAMEAYRDIPIVMVTSKDERIDRIRGFDAGVDAYLNKPTDAAELLRIIRRHLRRNVAPPASDS